MTQKTDKAGDPNDGAPHNMLRSIILSPLTADGRFGYDQFGQLRVAMPESIGWSFYFVKDVRGMNCMICRRSWVPGPAGYSADDIEDQALWRIRDAMVHRSCLEHYYSLRNGETVHNALCTAIIFTRMVEVPNEYRNDRLAGPWYAVDPEGAGGRRLVIGHRKRVWSIRMCSDTCPFTELELAKATEEFAADSVTKGFRPDGILLHAWGDKKLEEYLQRLAKLFGFFREDVIRERREREDDGL
jgi:hypothetical protein